MFLKIFRVESFSALRGTRLHKPNTMNFALVLRNKAILEILNQSAQPY